MITGETLKEWGHKPGPWFKPAITRANEMLAAGASDDELRVAVAAFVPPPAETIPLHGTPAPYEVFLEPESPLEADNLAKVRQHMDVLMRVPTLKAGAVMPDACPSGSAPGTIPVGGVVVAEDAIHPGFHSADICCSMAITIFKRDDDEKRLLDIAEVITHFGIGDRRRLPLAFRASDDVRKQFAENPFLKDMNPDDGLGTQGDGNHFLYVGRLASTGQLAMITHHGSRNLGAKLYKRGMDAAKRYTGKIAPAVPEHNAWIKADSDEGRDYWAALQAIRAWTKENHFVIHEAVTTAFRNRAVDRYWNEHNFVFQRSDGLFYHAKGATPSYAGFATDSNGLTLIPMNMAAPILITEATDRTGSLGFAPHGAGRNSSRTQFLRENTPVAPSIDLRSYSRVPDLSEYPEAYKNHESVTRQIEGFGLARIVDRVMPYGSIMAGQQPWERRKGKTAAPAEKEDSE
jgi:RNA-splicing ligase RtcB